MEEDTRKRRCRGTGRSLARRWADGQRVPAAAWLVLGPRALETLALCVLTRLLPSRKREEKNLFPLEGRNAVFWGN